MMQEIFYRCLDFVSTILEIGLLYACNDIFCKQRRHSVWNLFPYITTIILVYVTTWEVSIGAAKFLVMMIYFLTAQKIVTRMPLHRLAAAFSLYTMLLALPGYIGMIIIDGVFGYTSTIVGGHVVVIWQEYLMNCLVTVCCIWGLRKGFAKFEYDVTVGNVTVIILYGIITYVLFSFIGSDYYAGEIVRFDSALGTFGLLMGCLMIILFLYYKNNILLKQQMLEMELKYAFYQDKAKEEERIREIYHDLKNHLLLLQAKVQNNQETQQMVASLQEQISDYESFQNTGNEFLDIIIRDKFRIAKEENIDFNAILHFEDGGFIEPLDISTIFGNALDNAIEASRMLEPEERMITVKAKRFHDMLSIVIRNNRPTEIEKWEKEDSFLHGFGRRNIKRAVDKYEGQVIVKQGEKDYTLKIIIPIP